MGNSSTAKIIGPEKVVLQLSSNESLTLTKVLHVPKVRKNLVSGSILSKKGFKLVFEANEFVITKNGVFVGKCYISKGLFKMSVSSVGNKITSSSAYIILSPELWHARLGHVNYSSLKT